MSEQRPYNDDQWIDLPIPDGDTSWQKMEVLLDKDKRRIRPFWFRWYVLTGMLVAGLAAGTWMWFASSGEKEVPKTPLQESTVIPPHPGSEKGPPMERVTSQTKEDMRTPSEHTSTIDSSVTTNLSTSKNILPLQEPQAPDAATSKNRSPGKIVQKETIWPDKQKPKSSDGNLMNSGDPQKQPASLPSIVSTLPDKKNDTVSVQSKAKKDSVSRKDSAGAILPPPVVAIEPKKAENKNKSSFVWTAGVGLQQAIAFNGQQSSSFNYKGQESSLSDHIPSVYLRLHKKKWFAQVEFQYAVPQPLQQFSYSQKTRYDASSSSLNVERFTLQKLYYHQLPVSLNYQFLPNLSFGAGVMYNLLAGAVTEKEMTSKNVLTGTETNTKTVAPIKGFKDSFLYKTTAGILWQTEYSWQRFSFGLRFTQNLQPFIKYTKPDGTVLDEKNQVLQAILRIRLWSSR